jgi:NAD(P)-dependent dehydrogenase (short-subunit alcohol dehydrogenase family)
MPCERLRDRTALITGAGSGVGRATAVRFAAEGCRAVYLFGRGVAKLADVAREVEAQGSIAVEIVGDVGVDADCERAVDQVVCDHGGLDILVGNAPALGTGSILEVSRDDWDRVMRIQLRASFVLGQLAARAMVARGSGGSILYTLSVSGLGASAGHASYGASKAATLNLVQTMALELVDYGIRVNAVSPGPLDTPQSVVVLGSEEAMARARESWPLVPMNRLGRPEEIAAAFAYLASDDAAYVTGTNVTVDGGLMANTYSIPEHLKAK